MSTGLGWFGIGAGLVGGLTTFVMASISAAAPATGEMTFDKGRAKLAALFALLFTIILWALAMQKRVPYSPGQTLGLGFLIGGITGTCAILPSLRLGGLDADSASTRSRRLAVLSNAFLSLCGVSVTYVIFQGDPRDALLGFSIGIAMAAILHYYLQPSHTAFAPAAVETGAVFSITVASAMLFAVRHFDETPLRTWWALPILMAATVLIASYVGAEISSIGKLREKVGTSYILAVLISGALVIGLSAVYAWRLIGSWELVEVTATGIGIAAIIAWLAASISDTGRGPNVLEIACASVILIAAFAAVTFKLWAGLGMAIGLIAASAVVLPALAHPIARAGAEDNWMMPRVLQRALYLGLAFLLFRLFVQEYRNDLNTADIRIQYAFIGAMFGVILPFILGASLLRIRSLSSGTSSALALIGIVITGLFAAASPVLIFMLWDVKAVMGFTFGLTAAAAFLLLVQLPASDRRNAGESLIGGHSLALLSIAAQLIAVQFIGPLSELELPRTTRIWVLAAAGFIWLAWFVITNIISARRAA